MRCHNCGQSFKDNERHVWSEGDHGYAVHPVCPSRKFKYRFERWAYPLSSKRGQNEIGTIRTTPENYFVADVFQDGSIKFDPTMEAMTQHIDQQSVKTWWDTTKKALGIGQPLMLAAPRPQYSPYTTKPNGLPWTSQDEMAHRYRSEEALKRMKKPRLSR